jgi:hypothetical protein
LPRKYAGRCITDLAEDLEEKLLKQTAQCEMFATHVNLF